MAAGVQVASLFAKISADAKDYEKTAKSIKSDLNVMQRGFDDWGKAAATIGKAAAVGLAAAGAAIVGIGIAVAKTGTNFNAMKEQAQISFTTMLGSGERAKAFLDDLQKFAASTPFEFPELVQASQRLLAMGIAAQDVKPMLTAVGDAVAALGGTSETVNRVTIALGQMSAKGKVSAEEMMQLTEAGIPAWDMLAKAIGVSIPEAMKMATKGSIQAGTAINALVDGMNERFGGLMEQQSTTFNGLISTIKDNFAILSGTIMAPFFDMMRDGLKRVAAATQYLTEHWGKLTKVWEDGSGALMDLLIIFGMSEERAQQWGQAYYDAREKLEDIILSITNFGKLIWSIVKPIGEMIGKFVTWKDALTALGVILGWVAVTAIGGLIAAMWPMLATLAAVTTAIGILRWAWENDFFRVQTVVKEVFGNITKWIDTNLGSVEFMLSDSGDYWAEIYGRRVPTLLVNVVGIIKGWVNNVLWQLELWKNRAIDNFNTWKADTLRIFGQWVIDAKIKFGQFVLDMKLKLDDWLFGWRVKFADWQMQIGAWKRDTLKTVKEFVETWFGWFDPASWAAAGRDWIQGLWNGVTEKWNSFKRWWDGIWTSLKTGWQQFWQSHSPSQWFTDQGAGWMEGLTSGVESGVNAVTSVIDKLNRDVQDGLIKSFQVFEDGTYRILQLSDNVTKGVIKNGQLMMTGWEKAAAPIADAAKKLAPTTNQDAPFVATPMRSFAVDMAKALANNMTTRVSDVNAWLDEFVGDFMSAVTAPGQKQFSYAGAAANATKVVSASESTNLSANSLLASLNTLIAELRSRGLGNQFNLNMAPTATGNTQADLRATVEWLQAMYA